MRTKRILRRSLFLLVAAQVFALRASAESPYELDWVKQIGSDSDDFGQSVATDPMGNSFIAGVTSGNLVGDSLGLQDAFLVKYGIDGSVAWSKQFGSDKYDGALGVTADHQGDAYVTGPTRGTFSDVPGESGGGFLAKYAGDGSLKWSRQFGDAYIEPFAVAVSEQGEILVSGRDGVNGSFDASLRRFDASGNELWSRTYGSAWHDLGSSVAIDNDGNSFLSGSVADAPFGDDAFLAKYDSSGNQLWVRRLGTEKIDASQSVAVDADGNAFIAGYTTGNLGGENAGFTDAFLAKYSPSGSLLWSRLLGTDKDEVAFAVCVDTKGDAYISGYTDGTLGAANAGHTDLFLTKFNGQGSLLWSQQFGTAVEDQSLAMALDKTGRVHLTGLTRGDLAAVNAGQADVYLATLSKRVHGDTNGDQVVDLEDLNNVRNNFGGTGLGDTDGDNDIDLNDLNNVRNDFGIGSSNPVPEPLSLALLATGAVGIVARRWIARR